MSFNFYSRGIGSEVCSCFVCGEGEGKLQSNISGVVKPEERQQIIHQIFHDMGARIHRDRDYQMIIGACPRHEKNLEELDKRTWGGSISEQLVNNITSKY